MRFNTTNLLFIIVLFLIVSTCPTFAFEKINIQDDIDTAYLPFSVLIDRDHFIPPDCSYPEKTLYKVFRAAQGDKQDGLIIFSNNPSPNGMGVSIFSPKSYPEFLVTDDDPIRYTITNWDIFEEPETGDPLIVGICHNSDSLFLFTLNEATDKIKYRVIYVNSTEHDFVPNANILSFSDLDNDSKNEIVFYIEFPRHFRKIYCYNLNNLEKKWVTEISSGVYYIHETYNDSLEEKELILVTRNSANGIKDEIFNDFYSYLTKLNSRGEIIYNKIVGKYQNLIPLLKKSDVLNQYFLIHYLDLEKSDSLTGKNENQYFISRIDNNCNTIERIVVKSSPVNLWLIYDNSNTPYLYVAFRSKEVAVYDMKLNLVYETTPLLHGFHYNGKIKIAGEQDSVFVFKDGIYDHTYTKLLQFPFNSNNFEPVKYDSLGNVESFIIHESQHYLIGYIKEKTNYELLSVFYHRSQLYILMIFSGLLVGLVMVNFYRSKNRKNLIQISNQKKELEITHKALRDAQETIISQEKFQLAKNIAGGFAHEIRNSLFPARSALSKLNHISKDKLTDENWIKKISKFADNAVERAIDLTKLISQYTRLESEKNDEPVDVNLILKNVLKDNSYIIESKNINIIFKATDDSIVLGNNDQFYIILNNLILNAIDAMENSDTPQLIINTKHHNNKIIVDITDNGIGISNESIDKLFDVFYSTKPSSGSGLGLAIVKKILELYESSITVKSTLGKGSTFSIQLQVYEVEDPPNAKR